MACENVFAKDCVLLIVSHGLTSLTPSLVPTLLSSTGKLLWVRGIFDIFAIKFNIRPPEPLPKSLVKGKGNCDIIHERHSCRSFQHRKLHQNDRDEILQIARIESKKKFGTAPIRFQYVDSPLRVWPTVNASEFLVAIGPADYNRTSVIDIGHSLEAVVLHATKLGLGTCWIGPGADQNSVANALSEKGTFDQEKEHIMCVCAIGYKSKYVPLSIRLIVEFMTYARKPRKELFFADYEFKTSLDTKKYPFSKFEKCYEAARWSPSSYNAQPTRCVGVRLDGNKVRFDFFSSIKSRYYAPIATGIWLRHWEAACEDLGIKGKFIILAEKERFIKDNLLPIYEMSWIQE